MALIPKEKRLKFDAKSKEYIFVGYMETQKGYRLIDKETDEVIAARDVKVIEKGNGFCNTNVTNDVFDSITEKDASSVDESRENDELDMTIVNSIDSNSSSSTILNECTTSVYQDAEDDDYEPDETVATVDQPLRRSEREIRPVDRYESSLLTMGEPVTVQQALDCDKKLHWQQAMNEEYQSLMNNKTWILVDLPRECKAIRNKWVFTLKTDSAGNIERYKARLVAKGCSQRPGFDYTETYSPVIRYSSLRLLMAKAVEFGLHIDQMDVVTAFLHGDIEETIYMLQPESFDDNSGRVCQLKKSIYGLKQASRQWNIKLNHVLEKAGYKRCKKDSCIYVRRDERTIVIIAVYVDDMLILYNNNQWKDQLKSTLRKNFCMKDLGSATNVLKIQIEYDRKNGIIQLSQRKYAEYILRRFNMFDCTPIKLPSDPNQRLTMEMAPSTDDEIEQMKNIPYQEAVGSILYLAQCTRPDVSFSVTNVSQFNKNHGMAHWKAVKRILRYIKGTLDCKLIFTKSNLKLSGYCDADWGSSFCNFASCTGCFYLARRSYLMEIDQTKIHRTKHR